MAPKKKPPQQNCAGQHKGKAASSKAALPATAQPEPEHNKPNNVFGAYVNPYRFDVQLYGKPKPITVLQDFSENIWPGGALWECGVLLGKLLQDPVLFPPGEWQGLSVVELGCGPGLTGMVAAALGANVVLTDKPQVVEQITQPNVLNNTEIHKHRAAAVPLWWGDDVTPVRNTLLSLAAAQKAGSQKHGGRAKKGSGASSTAGPGSGRAVDIVIGTDLAYESVHFSKLLASLLELCEEGSRWILGQRHRREFSEDLIHMISEHFELEKTIPAKDIDKQYSAVTKPIYVFFFRRKARKGSRSNASMASNSE